MKGKKSVEMMRENKKGEGREKNIKGDKREKLIIKLMRRKDEWWEGKNNKREERERG